MAKTANPDILADIAKGDLAPIYCLHGSERFLVDRAVAAIRTAALGGEKSAPAAFDRDVFDLRETPFLQVIAAARTLPMWSKRRLVIASGIDAVKAEQMEPLLAYVADPNPRCCLVLLGEKVDGRLRVFLALRKAGFLHEFARLRDRDLVAWLAGEARRRRLAIDSAAVAALAEAAGPDLGRVVQALEQVALFANGPIKREHVEEIVPESRERGIFELTRAIATGDSAQAVRLVANLLRNREPALKIQFMLLRQLRQIWRAKELVAASTPRDEMASAIGIAPFFLEDVLTPARRMSTTALVRSFAHLYQADRSLKSSRIDPEVQMTRLVRRLAEEAAGK
ncbi:MAG: DNA polymerase III subunit delta [Deltaproteobacteria bacterium]|nr:DNA polymerase III subunit delta [Deltaproteobacteria bacterium]